MKNTLRTFVLVLAMIFTVQNVHAEDESSESSGGNKDESWYWQFGFGGGTINYDNDTKKVLEDLDLDGGTKINFNLGFYWPLSGHRTMLGVATTAVNHANKKGDADISFMQSSLCFSMQHFLMSNIGDGLFLRGDLGFGRFTTTAESGSTTISDSSESGLAFLVGTGYSIPLSDETRLPIGVSYFRLNVNDSYANNILVNVSVMF